jgi:NAD(P)-dependent dehydrogenase (short-subunit alcohol dehydrogenase family)
VQFPPKSLSIVLLAIAMGVASGGVPAETVLITGANQGIGLEFAKQYAARGWTVIATHRRTTTPEELANLAAKYPKVRIERMDVTDAAQIEAEAVGKMVKTIDGLSIRDTGRFMDNDGKDHPW